MEKLSIKKLAFVSCLLVSTSFASAAQAANCKVKVKYSDFPLSNTIVGTERYTIHLNSTSTTLRKHMRVVKNYGARDVSVKYWDATGNHWKTVRKGQTKKISGDLKKVKCLDKVKGKKPKPKKALKFKGDGYWRSSNTNKPKGNYKQLETTKEKCKSMCLKSSSCTGIEYTTFSNPKKTSCELHTDKFHHLEVNYNPKANGKVWLVK